MTPAEAVKLAAKTVGGKNGEAFVPPVSEIVYSTPGMNSSQGSAKEKRIFADISLKEVIDIIDNSKKESTLDKAEKIENYYGFENPISGEELKEIGISQAKRLGVNMTSEAKYKKFDV